MVIDLHAHSALSDGTDAPSELVRRAAQHGVDVVALTDHDLADGWAEASAEGERLGIRVLLGIEISTRHRRRGVHLLAYGVDPEQPALAAALASNRRGREDRLDAWVSAARAQGIELDPDRVLAHAGGSASLSKNHVAAALIESGAVADRDQAFAELLGDGMPMHVRRAAPSLEEALGLVRDAGGTSVLAHPWARSSREVLDEAEIGRLADDGLAGVEVDHEDHPPDVRDELRAIATRLDLVITGSSDYHGTNKSGHELGSNVTAPDMLDRLVHQ